MPQCSPMIFNLILKTQEMQLRMFTIAFKWELNVTIFIKKRELKIAYYVVTFEPLKMTLEAPQNDHLNRFERCLCSL